MIQTIQTQNNSTNLENLENSHLAIQISLEGLSYCVFDKDLVDIILLKSFDFDTISKTPEEHLENVKSVFQLEPLLSQKFESINITHKNRFAAIVPNVLYQKENHTDYLKYSIKVLQDDFVAVDDLKEIESKNIYIPFININNFLIDHYGSFEYLHTSSVLVSKLLKYSKYDQKKLFYVNVSKNNLDIVYIKDNKLELYNSFLFVTEEDFLYYILFAMEQLFLNPDEQELVLLGSIDKESPLYKLTYQYIRNISFLKTDNFSLSDYFYVMNPHIKRHDFFELLNQF